MKSLVVLRKNVFDHITVHASTLRVKHLIGFPYFIHELLIAHNGDLKTSKETFSGILLIFNDVHELFIYMHVVDIQGEHSDSFKREVVPPIS